MSGKGIKGIKARKKSAGYETLTPVCASCSSYQAPVVVLRESLPSMQSKPYCNALGFVVHPFACCDLWAGRKGEVLNKEAGK